MLQDDSSIGWDPLEFHPYVSLSLRIYAFFAVIAVIVTTTRLISLWIAAPPFWLSRQAHNPDYLRRLRTESDSVKQWMICTLLGWGGVASIELVHTSTRLVVAMVYGTSTILFAIRDFSMHAELASVIALFLFLVRWHLLNRIDRLDK